MGEILTAFLGGGAGAALISGFFTWLQSRRQRRSRTEQALVDGLKFLLLDVIAQRAAACLQEGAIDLRDRQLLGRMHDVYHKGLGGNGDLDALMAQVDRLPVLVEVRERSE